MDDDDNDDATKTEAEVRETIVRDRQLRGYGIGGAGNIRKFSLQLHPPQSNPRYRHRGQTFPSPLHFSGWPEC